MFLLSSSLNREKSLRRKKWNEGLLPEMQDFLDRCFGRCENLAERGWSARAEYSGATREGSKGASEGWSSKRVWNKTRGTFSSFVCGKRWAGRESWRESVGGESLPNSNLGVGRVGKWAQCGVTLRAFPTIPGVVTVRPPVAFFLPHSILFSSTTD